MYVEYLSHRCHGMENINNIYIYNVCVKKQTHIHNKIEKKKIEKKKKQQPTNKKKEKKYTNYLFIYIFIYKPMVFLIN